MSCLEAYFEENGFLYAKSLHIRVLLELPLEAIVVLVFSYCLYSKKIKLTNHENYRLFSANHKTIWFFMITNNKNIDLKYYINKQYFDYFSSNVNYTCTQKHLIFKLILSSILFMFGSLWPSWKLDRFVIFLK